MAGLLAASDLTDQAITLASWLTHAKAALKSVAMIGLLLLALRAGARGWRRRQRQPR